MAKPHCNINPPFESENLMSNWYPYNSIKALVKSLPQNSILFDSDFLLLSQTSFSKFICKTYDIFSCSQNIAKYFKQRMSLCRRCFK